MTQIRLVLLTILLRISSLLRPPPHIDSILPSDIITKIKSLKSHRAPGESKITNLMLKNLHLKFIFKITMLINAIIKYSYFPPAWKVATIVPILKPKKPVSYRPISLLNSISKIAEHFIYQIITDHLNTNNILIPYQFSFKPNLSATHQVFRLVNHITNKKKIKFQPLRYFWTFKKLLIKNGSTV